MKIFADFVKTLLQMSIYLNLYPLSLPFGFLSAKYKYFIILKFRLDNRLGILKLGLTRLY